MRFLTLTAASCLFAGAAYAGNIAPAPVEPVPMEPAPIAMPTQWTGGYAAGVGLSSMGPYASVSYQAMPRLRVRGLLAGLPSYETTEEEVGIVYDIDASIGGAAALADYYPNETGFRLSGGLFFAGTDVEGNARARGGNTIEVNGTAYSNASINAAVSFENEIAPMIAIGYEKRFRRGWAFEAEIGAIAIGGVEVDVSGENIPARDLEAEARELEDELSGLKAYPWIALGVSYRF